MYNFASFPAQAGIQRSGIRPPPKIIYFFSNSYGKTDIGILP